MPVDLGFHDCGTVDGEIAWRTWCLGVHDSGSTRATARILRSKLRINPFDLGTRYLPERRAFDRCISGSGRFVRPSSRDPPRESQERRI